MPVRLSARWLLAAALVAAGGFAASAAAKPPDLPIDPKVNCQVSPAGVKIDVDIRFHFTPPLPEQPSAQQPATPPALRVRIGRTEREPLPMPEVVEEIGVMPGVEECEVPGDAPRPRLFDLLFIPEPIGVMPQVEEVKQPIEAGWCLCEARPCPPPAPEAEPQVMLAVTVAEVDRAAARENGLECVAGRAKGVVLDSGAVLQALRTLQQKNKVKVRAEPRMVTVSGQPAFFHSGGEFPVPVVNEPRAIAFVPCGLQLQMVSAVTDGDRVRFALDATVSDCVPSDTTNVAGHAVPVLAARSVKATTELCPGQTFAVGGFSDPSSKSVLVVFVRPEVVRPGAADRTKATAPADAELRQQQARVLFRQAEKHRHADAWDRAGYFYEMVCRLCPDSDLAAEAGRWKESLARWKEARRQEGATEEQEECPGDMASPKQKQDAAKLARAKEVFRQAEEARRAGDHAVAWAYYESIRCLCPGSRVAEKAARRLEEMATQRLNKFLNGQDESDPVRRINELMNQSEELRKIEQEWERIGPVDQPAHQCPERIDGGCQEETDDQTKSQRKAFDSMSRAYAALRDGHFEEAQAHALEALSLAPGHPAAVAALCQASAALRKAAPQTDAGHCPYVPPAMRRPSLPPADPAVVNDLEKLLFDKEKLPPLPSYPGRTEEVEPAKKPSGGARAPVFFVSPKEIVLEIVEEVKKGTSPR